MCPSTSFPGYHSTCLKKSDIKQVKRLRNKKSVQDFCSKTSKTEVTWKLKAQTGTYQTYFCNESGEELNREQIIFQNLKNIDHTMEMNMRKHPTIKILHSLQLYLYKNDRHANCIISSEIFAYHVGTYVKLTRPVLNGSMSLN